MIFRRTYLSVGAAMLAMVAVLHAEDEAFWKLVDGPAIEHAFPAEQPLVVCMQGRQVVVQVEADREKRVRYKARFFGIQKKPDPRLKVWLEGGGPSTPKFVVNGRTYWTQRLVSARFDGILSFDYAPYRGAAVRQTIYPSMDQAALIEEWQVTNVAESEIRVAVAKEEVVRQVGGKFEVKWSCPELKEVVMAPGEVKRFVVSGTAKQVGAVDLKLDVASERQAREALVDAAWRGAGRLETPEAKLDAAFALQKLHVLECPVQTYRGVITHNGSLTYSPGVWANDPVEYSSPLFPFFGDEGLNEASMNMYRLWLSYIREHGSDPFPGSFEGPTLRLAQKYRGDDAMMLYGLSKFLLFQGDRKAAEEMWPLVEFSDVSIQKHLTKDGIIASKTDEMEGRYPTGDANLSTSALAYGGYRMAAHLARSLGKPEANELDGKADRLRKAIESYFGATVEGFETYRYYRGNETLRGWILLPQAMGISDRQEGTVAALTSDKLWPGRAQGADILAESTRETEWGRETYYALRVLYLAGRTELATDLTQKVVGAQIFGPRGPYPDEDAIDMLCPGSLYPRVFTEGMFGIVPTGLDSFECTPRLPDGWPRMALRDVRAFGNAWDLVVERVEGGQRVTITRGEAVVVEKVIKTGQTLNVRF